NKKRARYSLLTFVLLLCIIELVISNIQNINKTIHFKSKIKGLEQKRDEELNRNQDLKSEIKNFNSEATLESIARNNLKMAGKDEVLILINEPKVEQTQSDSDTDKKKDKNKTINE
ncbi:septum formation initiator family protein, partial [bacterium]|nr:septum formation initiator family protein [bacterium]